MRYFFWVWLLSVGFISGCGSGVEMASVEGTITLDGQPVTEVIAVFHPEVLEGSINAPTRPSMGETDAEGRYSLSTKTPGDGAAVGNHKVSIVPVDRGKPLPGKLKKFEFEVKPGENTIDLELVSAK